MKFDLLKGLFALGVSPGLCVCDLFEAIADVSFASVAKRGLCIRSIVRARTSLR